MRLGRLTEEQIMRHEADPFGAGDTALRQQFRIPENRYYTVTVWPEQARGLIYLDEKRTREARAQKISKSDQS